MVSVKASSRNHFNDIQITGAMNRNILLCMLLGLAAAGCNRQGEVRLGLFNPLDETRADANLVIDRSTIEGWTAIPAEKVPLLTEMNGDPIPCQVDDIDGNGQWDELFVVTDLGPEEEKIARLVFVLPEDYPSFVTRTNLRMGANRPGYPELEKAERLEGITYHNHSRTGEIYQMEGPAWENDRVGFRNYLDQRNGMDIFGKLTAQMVLDSVGIAGRQSYHEPDTWGMDVLKVGTSLGAGSIAYLFGDSLYRVGDSGSGAYRAIIEGPLRSCLELSFNGWQVSDHAVDVVHRIGIAAGSRYYSSSITRSGREPEMDPVAGIVNMKSDSLYVLDLNGEFTGFMTHDLQSEDTTMLAMALVVPSARLKDYGKAPESGEGITETYYVVLDAESSGEVGYRFYALWEREDQRWASRDEVTSFLRKEADRWSEPLLVEKLR